MSYFSDRMQKLGITEEVNRVKLLKSVKQENKIYENELVYVPVFKEVEKGIEIPVYNLKRETIRIEKEGSRYKKDWSITRLENPIVKSNGDVIKYLMPKGSGSHPFFPPHLLDKFEAKEKVETLYITEGFIKAFVAGMNGIDMIGVASITHLKEKGTGALHSDILAFIIICQVKRVIWLMDGDANDLSSKLVDGKEVDLYSRPSQFFSTISTFKQLLDDYNVDKYFMHPDCDAIVNEFKVPRAEVKGIDDVLIYFPEKVEDIKADLESVSKPGFWFQKFNVTTGLSKVRDYFRLNNVNTFYLFHAERNEHIKNKEFIFHGTHYLYNDDKGECEVKIPADAKNYFRSADFYYKWVNKPNKYKIEERIFSERQKGTIRDDHGKDIFQHIPKYDGMCNIPDHVNYQQVIKGFFNLYSPLNFTADEELSSEEDCATIIGFIHHIFGDNNVSFIHPKTKERKTYSNFELGLDYIELLYKNPAQILPILCLVSKENMTGKTTFGKLMRQIFGSNCAIIGNADMANDFNAHWATKLLVICDETKIDKQAVVEKVKSLSTSDKIMMNAKGKNQVEIDCISKFILISNNEDNFIYATDDDTRYWVLKIPVIQNDNPDLLVEMVEEIPAFLAFLEKRKLVTEKLSRAWIHTSLLMTDALKKVQQNSLPTIIKELNFHITQKFMDFNVDEFMMTTTDVRKEFFNNKYEANYVKKALVDDLKMELYHEFRVDEKDFYTYEQALDFAKGKYHSENELDVMRHIEKTEKVKRYSFPRHEYDSGKKENLAVDVFNNGRPYVFKRERFLKDIPHINGAEIKTVADQKPSVIQAAFDDGF